MHRWLSLFTKVIAVYSENDMECFLKTPTLCGQNAELLNVRAGGTFSSKVL